MCNPVRELKKWLKQHPNATKEETQAYYDEREKICLKVLEEKLEDDEYLEELGIIEYPKTTKVIDGEDHIMAALKSGNDKFGY